MSDTPIQRLGSIHLEDVAIVALTSRFGVTASAHPDLDDDRRSRLRSRIKQLSRHDWPANLQEDPLVRRGYTLRQCLRLVVALMLVDAHLPPGFAIAVARANEGAFIGAMVDRIGTGPDAASKQHADLVAVLLLGELVDLVANDAWRAVEPQRVRFIERKQLTASWPADYGLGPGSQQLVIDVGGVASSVWSWLLDRRLMTPAALDQLVTELAACEFGFRSGEEQIKRR